MNKKKDSKTIKNVSSSSSARGVKAATEVTGVKGIDKTTAVQKTARIANVKTTSGAPTLDFEKRDKYFAMVSEEADKLAKQGILPKNSREIIEQAVKVAIDAALLEPTKESENEKKTKQ